MNQGHAIDAEDLLEVNIKDEATNVAEVDAPQETIGDLDLTEDIVADEFVLLENEGDETAKVTVEDDTVKDNIEEEGK